MAKYFYTEEGHPKGPVSPKQIMDLILEDRLTVDSSVMESGSPIWHKISEISPLMRYLHECELTLDNAEEGKLIEEDARAPLFFHIPLGRLALLSLISFGWYELYWFFRNWQYLHTKYRKKTGISFMRDVINPFAISRMFFHISADKDLLGASPREDFTSRGWMWIFLLVVLSVFSSGIISFLTPVNDLIEAVVCLISLGATLFCLLPVQHFINAANQKLGKDLSRLSFGHYATITLGVFGWLFSLSVWIPALLRIF